MSDSDHENRILQISVERHDETGVVRARGKIVRENQAELRKQLEELIAAGADGIALDLQGVSYMDSAGLGCCASVAKSMREGAGADRSAFLVVFNASPNVEKMWKLIRLDLVIPICEEEKDALTVLAERS